jgi:hypothetical protein
MEVEYGAEIAGFEVLLKWLQFTQVHSVPENEWDMVGLKRLN